MASTIVNTPHVTENIVVEAPASALTSAIAAPVAPQEVARQAEPVAVAAEVVAPAVAVAAPIPAPEPIVIAAPVVEAAPVTIEVPTPQAAPVIDTPVVAPVTAVARPAPTPATQSKVEDLSEVLRHAGLVLAATNPEKLRAAQEEAAKYVAPVRVPRERKPLPPQSTEPLVQMETKR